MYLPKCWRWGNKEKVEKNSKKKKKCNYVNLKQKISSFIDNICSSRVKYFSFLILLYQKIFKTIINSWKEMFAAFLKIFVNWKRL